MIKINATFEGGNIEVVNISSPQDIVLQICKDTKSDFFQWFYFCLEGGRYQNCKLRIINAGQSSYPKGWEEYRAVASYDRKSWFRVPTAFDGEVLSIFHTPEQSLVYYAYFAPYSLERHLDLIAQAQQSPFCDVKEIGKTIENRSLHLLSLGDFHPEKKKIWIIARQHPGETMAEWFMEGMIHRLLDQADPVSRSLRSKAVLYLVPNMNPDGSVHGNLRTNASGANLNREWATPSPEKSPEVYEVRQWMYQTGVDLFLDIHGDEGLPYNFLVGCEGAPNFSPRKQQLEETFKQTLLQASPDFQVEEGYPKQIPGQVDLGFARNYISESFDCLAFTLEMPFKDNANAPDPIYGWSPERAMNLGKAILYPILATLDSLRS